MKKRSSESALSAVSAEKKVHTLDASFDDYVRRWPTRVDGSAFQAVAESYFPAVRSTCRVFGQLGTVPRDEVMFTDEPTCQTYRYSNHDVPLLAFTPPVEALRRTANEIAAHFAGRPVHFQQVLLNGYRRNGQDRVGWHKDDERTIDPAYPIVSFSFGDTRDFVVQRDTDKAKRTYVLQDGDVVVMMPGMQERFRHTLPPRAGRGERRYNLTFRVYRA